MRKLTNDQRRAVCKKAQAFFQCYLFKKNPKLNQTVKVRLRFVKLEDAWGICDNHNVGIKPREFTIYINRDLHHMNDIITTVAHEMVHQHEWDFHNVMTHGQTTFFIWEEWSQEKT